MPTVSIVIATRNRCQDLKKALEGLAAQRLDGQDRYEVIVADNNSIDGTKEAVDALMPLLSPGAENGNILGLKYVVEPVQGKSRALNRGIREAKGDIIAFTDDDVLVDPFWLSCLLECFQKYGCDGVGGRVVPIFPNHTPRWIRDNPTKLAGVVVIADYGQETKLYAKPMDPFIGSNYAFKRNVFDDCGMFREDLGPGVPVLGEDIEFIDRLAAHGKILYYCGAALIRHPVDLSRLRLRPLAKWHVSLGRFAAKNEIQSSGGKFTYYFGVPRYLFKGLLKDVLLLVPSMFSRMSFYNRLRGLFRKAGMIGAYRLLSKKGKSSAK